MVKKDNHPRQNPAYSVTRNLELLWKLFFIALKYVTKMVKTMVVECFNKMRILL